MIEICRATIQESEIIGEIHRQLNRPHRSECNANEYLIAWCHGEPVGCAATSLHAEGAYFYGLAVRRRWQHNGVGSQLMQARLDALPATQTEYAVALVMFWNSRFFRKHGFSPVKRTLLPVSALYHSDLTDPSYVRSATMLRWINASRIPTCGLRQTSF